MPAAMTLDAAATDAGNAEPSGLATLLNVPESVSRVSGLIARFDNCLLVGFGRLGAEQNEALAALGRVMDGTPLGEPLAKALAGLQSNEFLPQHFAVLAMVRAAIQGARYDALHAQAAQALGRTANHNPPAPLPSPGIHPGVPANAPVLCDGTRNWLMELAITGFKQLDASTLAPFSATLENLQAEPALGRLASLLTGFQHELLAALPIGHGSTIPVHRWADLWSRAMVSSLQAERGQGLRPPAVGKVEGTLTVLGVDLRQHGSFVSAVIYALLETGKKAASRRESCA